MYDKQARWRSLASLIVAGASLVTLNGCTTLGTYFAHNDLKVNSKMSKTIFLDPIPDNERIAYVQYKNTTTKNLDGMPTKIKKHLKDNGWKVTNDPDDADNMLQVAVRQAGPVKNKHSFLASVKSGWGNAMSGSIAGLATGLATRNATMGTSVGAGVAVADWIGSQFIEDKKYSVITDVQVSRKVSGDVKQVARSQLQQGTASKTRQVYKTQSNWMRYRTRVGTIADQVNLDFKDAAPVIVKQQAKEIAGILS